MDDELTIKEEQRMGGPQQARLAADLIKGAVSPVEKAKLALSFGKKISQHWLILATAALFDLLGMIPFVCVISNFIFGLILFLYFGSRSDRIKEIGIEARSGFSVQSELVKIGLPMLIGNIIDFFLGILPANIGVTLIRIALS